MNVDFLTDKGVKSYLADELVFWERAEALVTGSRFLRSTSVRNPREALKQMFRLKQELATILGE